MCGIEVKNNDLLIHVETSHSQEEFEEFITQNPPPNPLPLTQVIRGENFSKQYSTNWAVGVTEFDIRIDVMNERRTTPPSLGHPELVQFISEVQIISTPLSAKILLERLGEAVILFEEKFGEITQPTS
jgi:hypothetical protein